MRKTLSTLLLLAAFPLLANTLEVEKPFARAVPAGQKNSAAFMTLKNNSAQPLILISASSSVADVTELHTHSEVDGVMQMRKVEQIDIPAHGITELKPGGLHIMLIGLKKELAAGSEIDLSLKFSDNSEQTLTLPVQAAITGHHKHQH